MTRATRFERFDPWWSEMVMVVRSGKEVVVNGQTESEARKLVHQMSSFRLTVQKEQMLAPTEAAGDRMRELYMAACSVEVQRVRFPNGEVQVRFTNRFESKQMQQMRAALQVAAGERSPAVTVPAQALPTMALPLLAVGGEVEESGSSPANPQELPSSNAMEDLIGSKFKL